MDIGTLIGLISSVAVIVTAVLSGFLIAIGGTLAATLIKFPIATFATALEDGTKAAFIDRGDDSQALILTAGGLTENAFLRRGRSTVAALLVNEARRK